MQLLLDFFYSGDLMGYLICGKCKSYYKLQSGESVKDFALECKCGGKFRYVENLDIVDPGWKPTIIPHKSTRAEILRNKLKSVSSFPQDLKYRLSGLWNRLRYRFQSAQNWNNTQGTHGNYYDYGMNPLNSLRNELNLKNIRWTLVIPVIAAITLILTFTPGILTILTFILLVALGYAFNNQILGIKNALIAGALSFFLGSLFTGSFLLLIPFTILGAINGAVCGWIGGYIKKIRSQRSFN
jgi:hypothetical protein